MTRFLPRRRLADRPAALADRAGLAGGDRSRRPLPAEPAGSRQGDVPRRPGAQARGVDRGRDPVGEALLGPGRHAHPCRPAEPRGPFRAGAWPSRAPGEADRGPARPGARGGEVCAADRERPGARPVVSRNGHDGDHLSLLRPIRDGHRRPGRSDPALRREVRELQGRRAGRDHRGRSGSNAGVAGDRRGSALGHPCNRSRDRADPRRALPLARRARRDARRCRNRLRRLASKCRLVRRVAGRHHPARRRACSRRTPAWRGHGLCGFLPARNAGAARRGRRTARRRPQGDD